MSQQIESQFCFRIFVLSDVHAYAPGKPRKPTDEPSYVKVPGAAATSRLSPLEDVQTLVASEAIGADVLICCGDLGDKADPVGIKHAWDELNRLKEKLNAPRLYTTVGNHDVDSRFRGNDYSAVEFLKGLQPPFPSADEGHYNRFWAQHFTIYSEEHIRFVVLNSCAYHGALDEHEKGRVSENTINAIRTRLSKMGRRGLNILVCHHHPQKHSEHELGDYDDMVNGQKLLDLIGNDEFGPWMLFHGHKHCPKISYAAGGVNSSIVFSAGSISAKLYPTLAANVRNQCYLVEFPICAFEKFGLVGTFTSWDWIPGRGCIPSGVRSGLPHKGGFGSRSSTLSLARQIRDNLKTPGRKDWDAVSELVPEVKYLLPSDLLILASQLKRIHGISLAFNEGGEITELEWTL